MLVQRKDRTMVLQRVLGDYLIGYRDAVSAAFKAFILIANELLSVYL